MDSDYPVTRRNAMTRAAVGLAKRAAKGPKSVTGQYGAVVGDVGIEPTAAVDQGEHLVPLLRRCPGRSLCRLACTTKCGGTLSVVRVAGRGSRPFAQTAEPHAGIARTDDPSVRIGSCRFWQLCHRPASAARSPASIFSAATEATGATIPRTRRSCSALRVQLCAVAPAACPGPTGGGLGHAGRLSLPVPPLAPRRSSRRPPPACRASRGCTYPG